MHARNSCQFESYCGYHGIESHAGPRFLSGPASSNILFPNLAVLRVAQDAAAQCARGIAHYACAHCCRIILKMQSGNNSDVAE